MAETSLRHDIYLQIVSLLCLVRRYMQWFQYVIQYQTAKGSLTSKSHPSVKNTLEKSLPPGNFNRPRPRTGSFKTKTSTYVVTAVVYATRRGFGLCARRGRIRGIIKPSTRMNAPQARRTWPRPLATIGRAPRIAAGSRRTPCRTGRRT